MKRNLILLIAGVALARVANAADTPETPPSNRMWNRLGISAGVLSEPFPSLWGVTVGYHWSDLIRASAGYGKASLKGFRSETLSAQATLLWPGLNLTPFLGFGVALSHFTTRLPSGFIEQVDGSGSYVYSSLGLEWQSRNGFNVGLGYRFFLPWNGGLPGAQVGWYF